LASLALLYMARLCLKSWATMKAIVFSLKHHRNFLTSEPLEITELS
jgi:hypothetical protein